MSKKTNVESQVHVTVEHKRGEKKPKLTFEVAVKNLLFSVAMLAVVLLNISGSPLPTKQAAAAQSPQSSYASILDATSEVDMSNNLRSAALLVKTLFDQGTVTVRDFQQLLIRIMIIQSRFNGEPFTFGNNLVDAINYTDTVLSNIDFTKPGVVSTPELVAIHKQVVFETGKIKGRADHAKAVARAVAPAPVRLPVRVVTTSAPAPVIATNPSTIVSAARQVSVFLNNIRMTFPDQQPVIVSGRTLVPVRFISEALGARVEWNDINHSVVIFHGQRVMALIIGETVVNVDSVRVPVDVPAQIIGGRTMVPLRFISEIMGATVSWDAANYRVLINGIVAVTPPRNTGVVEFDPAVHVVNGVMTTAKGIEFAEQALRGLSFVLRGDVLTIRYDHPTQPAGVVAGISSVSIIRPGFPEVLYAVMNFMPERLRIMSGQSWEKTLTGFRRADLDFIRVSTGVSFNRVSPGGIVVVYDPGGVTLASWVDRDQRGIVVQFDINSLFSWR